MITTLPRLELKHVSKEFRDEGRRIPAIEDVSLRVMPGELVTLIGPSGSGKSTLLNMIVGLLEPDQGEIWVDGACCDGRTGRFGYMPQRDLLLPWRTVLENAIIPLEIKGVPRPEALEQARALLGRFELVEFANAYPSALSGGMRQRAALLRTLLTGSDTLLLDEPFGALDALTRRGLQDWLLAVMRELERTLIFITHDVEEAVYLADRVVVLSARPGRIQLEMPVGLPRPRRQGMIASAEFGTSVARLLQALGVDI